MTAPLLAQRRWVRGFDAREVAEAKIARLTRWFASERIDAWAEEQCLSVLRTSALYGAVALLRAHGYHEALHRLVAVNFTDVVARLRAYLRAHIDPRMEVAYVRGADNARFALAFSVHGCCVVGRPGAAEAFDRWRRALRGNPNVLWAEGNHPDASRTLRRAPWRRANRPRLVLRLEDTCTVATLQRVDFPRFQSALLPLLAAHTSLRVVRQRPRPLDDVITLDPMAQGGRPLAISRLYALGGYESLGHTARPGTPPLTAQCDAIPPGRYPLHNDRTNGATLSFARALLQGRVAIEGETVTVSLAPDEDLADSRDFLLGTDHGGLAVRLLDGSIGRAPYLLPYVDPALRCRIAPSAAQTFSRRVWERNAEIFANSDLRVGNLPPPARATMAWMGHDRLLTEVCRWHAAALPPRPMTKHCHAEVPPHGKPGGPHGTP